jgi:hypothetical protein
MPFRGLYLNKEGEPRFNQPVPLPLIPLITDWGCRFLLEFLALGIDFGDRRIYPITAHVYDGTREPKSVHRTLYGTLGERLTDDSPEEAGYAVLPLDHFVWSDNLCEGFSEWCHYTWSPADAAYNDVRMIWGVDSSPVREFLEKAPDFDRVLDQTAIRHDESLDRYQAWCKRREELIYSGAPAYKKGKNGINELQIAKKIAKETGCTEDHVRKMIRKYRK